MLCKEFLYIGIKKTVGVLLIKHQKRKRNIVDRKTNRRRSSSQTNGFELLSNSPASMRFAFSVSRCIRRGFHGLLPMVARTWDWKSHGSHPFAPKMTWSLKYHGMLRLHSDGATGKTSNFPTIEQLLMRTTFCISLDPLFYPRGSFLSTILHPCFSPTSSAPYLGWHCTSLRITCDNRDVNSSHSRLGKVVRKWRFDAWHERSLERMLAIWEGREM